MLSRSTLRRGLSTAVCVVLVGGVLGAGARGDDAPPAPAAPPLVAAVERDRPALPAGSTDRGRAGVESSALRLARAVGGVPADATSPCPADRLRVSWEPPADGYAVGAHVDPVGPAPDAATTAVNGLVLCDGTRYAYLGFEARWDGGTWQVHGVPVLGGEHERTSTRTRSPRPRTRTSTRTASTRHPRRWLPRRRRRRHPSRCGPSAG